VNSISGAPAWFLRNQSAAYFAAPATPITNFSAFNGFDGSPGLFFLRQGFSLSPTPLLFANLNFDFAVQSSYGGPSRVFTANILDNSGTIQLANVFSFNQPTGSQEAWNPANVGLDIATALNSLGAGNYQLEFRIDIPEDFTGPAQFAIDNISLETQVVPEPSSLVLLGLGTIGVVFMGRRQRKRKMAA